MDVFAAASLTRTSLNAIVGNTPLIPLRSNGLTFQAKLEWYPNGTFDPLNSVKDRPAYYMIRKAEIQGLLQAGIHTVLEPTSGNTGIALVRIGKRLGYPVSVIVPDKASIETRNTLRNLGAEVTETNDDLCPRVGPGTDQAIALARALVASNEKRRKMGQKEYFMPNQYENEANFLAHYETTGPEIWRQTSGTVSHVFVGVGTGGTIGGIEKYLHERNPKIKVVAVEPQKNHRIQGLRNFEESDIPAVLARHIDVHKKKAHGEWVQVNDDEAFNAVRAIATEQNILSGPSSGAVLAAAQKYAESEAMPNGVLIFADSGDKYESLYVDEGILSQAEFSLLKNNTKQQI